MHMAAQSCQLCACNTCCLFDIQSRSASQRVARDILKAESRPFPISDWLITRYALSLRELITRSHMEASGGAVNKVMHNHDKTTCQTC